jgi:tyrosyl-tRNA synthetase
MNDKTAEKDPAVEKEVQRQLKILTFGTQEITPSDEFEKMLRHSIVNNKPLRVKCGIDPTGSDVHLGHLVPYKKMRQFQDLGHQGVVIIGDYTASIGDPTGRNEARPALALETIRDNASRYMDQLYTVLDKERTEVRFQSEWFAERNLHDVLRWAGQTTVAKLIGHDTFKDRLEKGHPLSLHELFYPVLQGIDSVYIKADVELGGSDQRFNVLMGRDYLKHANLRPQVAMLMPIIRGLCGTQKMSKSFGNYIGIFDEPFDKFGKVMSIPDELMFEYYQYVSGVSEEEFLNIKTGLTSGTLHPNEAKKNLAKLIVGIFHGPAVGQEMLEKFEAVFKKKLVPDDVEEAAFTRGTDIVELLVALKLAPSKGEARRLITQGGVKLIGSDESEEKISEPTFAFDESFTGRILKVGKRKFVKLK